ncbi:DUF1349 domain-containing protein [Pantoea sp. MBD-2R]|uniref:DUF1349 domain-containing protein n=1 Tax=Pantoea sp. MBD-2R TaxID=3141540 RepID=UPI0031841FA4
MKVIKSFSGDKGVWINKPTVSTVKENQLSLTTELNTDFWQRTYYGFQRHTGHAYGYYLDGDFSLQVRIKADFCELYDQAGILILDDDEHWVKAGIEFNDGQSSIGCVVTRKMSDWSTGLFPGNPGTFWMRATLENDALRIQYSTDGKAWPLLRLCYWPTNQRHFVGVMGCTPEREGLDIAFDEFSIDYPSGKALHDLT